MITAAGRLRGKVALVTGGGTGVGRGIALRFAAEGARVAVLGRRSEPLHEVVRAVVEAGGHARATSADVTVEADAARAVRETVDALGALHILVNSAGVYLPRTLAETTLEQFEHVFAVNVRGAFLMTRAAVTEIARAGGGVVINVSSNLGERPVRGSAVYAASKAALDMLTRALALEEGAAQVRACSLRLGIVDTPIHDATRSASDWEHKAGALHPLGRIGTPADAAAAAVYLASDEAAWTTGALVNVDGGIGLA